MLGILRLIPLMLVGVVEAGGFDNTGRPFGIIFDGENRQREVRWAMAHIAPDLSMQLRQSSATSGNEIALSGIVPQYENREWALRWNTSESTRCALRAEQPFRADVYYPDDALSYRTTGGQTAVAPVASRYNSESLSIACRLDISMNEWKWSIFAGPKHQKVSGYFSTDLSENEAGDADNLEVWLNGGSEWGALAGFALERPDIAFRWHIIYHNEIDYTLTGRSLTPTGIPNTPRIAASANSATRTPQSVHLGLQSGIAADWLAYAEFKWSEWSRVDEILVSDGVANPRLALYANDTLDVDIGLIHRLNADWRVGLSYATGLKLGSESLPQGADSKNLRDPQGKRHALSVGAKYWSHETLAIDLLLTGVYLESKRIIEDHFDARIESTVLPAFKLGISWHP